MKEECPLKKSLLRSAAAALGRIHSDRSGMAATEFALLLPIMATIFFGMLEASDAMMANRRVGNAANSLVDLVGQETQVTSQQLTSIITGVTDMLAPNSESDVSMAIISVSRDEDDPDRVIVDWSFNDAGASPYSPGSEFTKLENEAILHDGVSLIVAELEYEYHSGLTTKVIGAPITFKKITARWPRQSTMVALCQQHPSGPSNPPVCP